MHEMCTQLFGEAKSQKNSTFPAHSPGCGFLQADTSRRRKGCEGSTLDTGYKVPSFQGVLASQNVARQNVTSSSNIPASTASRGLAFSTPSTCKANRSSTGMTPPMPCPRWTHTPNYSRQMPLPSSQIKPQNSSFTDRLVFYFSFQSMKLQTFHTCNTGMPCAKIAVYKIT